MPNKNALILVDLQHDFCAGGSLAVPDGDAVISLANKLQPYFQFVIATQDWHPHNHKSFAANHEKKQVGDVIEIEGLAQTLWPIHCVQHSKGAELHQTLDKSRLTKVFYKGADEYIDSYSGFFDNGRLRATGLAEYLRNQKIDKLYIMGLATDYCVKFTVLDALSLGFEVNVIQDGARGVNLSPGDSDAAWQEMKLAGANLIQAANVFQASR